MLQGALSEAAPAKVNLALHVTGRRADGYHELESLVVFVDVADEVTAHPAKADRLRVVGPFAAAAGGGDSNLVMRAVKAFRTRWPHRLPEGLDIALTKNLPVAAGIGGGSADAAAMLRLLASMVGGDFSVAELSALALTLGADVPVCLLSRPSEVRGVGEIIHPLRSFPATHLVLVNPLIPVVTADVFRRLEQRSNSPMPALPSPLTRPAQLGLWLAETRNDLEPAAITLVPAIGELLREMRVLDGCALARMSGSGGTVFGLFGSATQAHQAAHDMRAKYPQFWVAAAPVIA